jgi:hypothetical protein
MRNGARIASQIALRQQRRMHNHVDYYSAVSGRSKVILPIAVNEVLPVAVPTVETVTQEASDGPVPVEPTVVTPTEPVPMEEIPVSTPEPAVYAGEPTHSDQNAESMQGTEEAAD